MAGGLPHATPHAPPPQILCSGGARTHQQHCDIYVRQVWRFVPRLSNVPLSRSPSLISCRVRPRELTNRWITACACAAYRTRLAFDLRCARTLFIHVPSGTETSISRARADRSCHRLCARQIRKRVETHDAELHGYGREPQSCV